jgi:hypothetical protein
MANSGNIKANVRFLINAPLTSAIAHIGVKFGIIGNNLLNAARISKPMMMASLGCKCFILFFE